MSTKAEKEILEAYKSQLNLLNGIITDLREEKAEYQLQISRMQEALIAIRAPEAYRDQRADRLGEPDRDPVEVERQKAKREVEQEWLNGIESPTFRNGEELQDLLSGVLFAEASENSSVSIHGNNES